MSTSPDRHASNVDATETLDATVAVSLLASLSPEEWRILDYLGSGASGLQWPDTVTRFASAMEAFWKCPREADDDALEAASTLLRESVPFDLKVPEYAIAWACARVILRAMLTSQVPQEIKDGLMDIVVQVRKVPPAWRPEFISLAQSVGLDNAYEAIALLDR